MFAASSPRKKKGYSSIKPESSERDGARDILAVDIVATQQQRAEDMGAAPSSSSSPLLHRMDSTRSTTSTSSPFNSPYQESMKVIQSTPSHRHRAGPTLWDSKEQTHDKKDLIRTKFLNSISFDWRDNLFIVVPFVYIMTIVLGCFVYNGLNAWDVPTSLFFSAQTLLGIGAGAPVEPNECSYVYSTILLLLGQSTVTGTIIMIVKHYFSASEEAARTRYRHVALQEIEDEEDDMKRSMWTYMSILWRNHHSSIISVSFFLLWMSLGAAYMHVYEGFTVIKSIYFVVSTLSGCGNVAPDCEDGDEYECTLGERAYFLTIFILVGFPLYHVNMAMMALYFISRLLDNTVKIQILKPWTRREFEFAHKILRPYNATSEKISDQEKYTLSLGDFLLMELLRLGQVDDQLLADLKELFSALDVDGDDRVSFEELQQIENAINLQEDLKANWERTRSASLYFDDAGNAEDFAELIKGFKGDVASRGVEMTEIAPSPKGHHFYQYKNKKDTMAANGDVGNVSEENVKIDRSKSNILFGCIQKSRNSVKNRIGFTFA